MIFPRKHRNVVERTIADHREREMNLAEVKAEMATLLDEVEADRRDVRDVYAHLHMRIKEMRAEQSVVPDELKRLAKQLEDECCAQSQGR